MSISVTSEKTWLDSVLRYGRDDDAAVWFVFNDIYAALGLAPSGAHRQFGRMKKRIPRWLAQSLVTDSQGRSRNTNIIKEDAVYTVLIPKSRKPSAIKFQEWVGRVIRTVRQTGSYSIEDDRRLALEEKKVSMDFINTLLRGMDLFEDDDRLKFLLKERLSTEISSMAIECKPPLGVSELMEDMKVPRKQILKSRSAVGRHVARLYRGKVGEPPKTKKFVQGHTVSVMVYPVEHHDDIRQWINEYLTR
jgi:prophage antirepressor-like protein